MVAFKWSWSLSWCLERLGAANDLATTTASPLLHDSWVALGSWGTGCTSWKHGSRFRFPNRHGPSKFIIQIISRLWRPSTDYARSRCRVPNRQVAIMLFNASVKLRSPKSVQVFCKSSRSELKSFILNCTVLCSYSGIYERWAGLEREWTLLLVPCIASLYSMNGDPSGTCLLPWPLQVQTHFDASLPLAQAWMTVICTVVNWRLPLHLGTRRASVYLWVKRSGVPCTNTLRLVDYPKFYLWILRTCLLPFHRPYLNIYISLTFYNDMLIN